MSYFLVYLIKSTVYLALFYAFFMLAMRGTTFFRFNRWMLLLGTFVCMLLPCCTITVSEVEGIRLPMQVLDEMLVLEVADTPMEDTPGELLVQEVSTSAPVFPYVLLGIYAVGILVYLAMVVRSFVEVWKLISRYPKQWKDGCWLVVVPGKTPSFSWGNYIVMSEEDYEDYPMVMAHERMHYRCRHTFDILYFTVVHALHWFNPMVWLVRMELKQLHEFEADEGVINQGIDATQYQILLVRKAVGKKLYTIANGFNHTKLQKRITMMIQEKSNDWKRLKWLMCVPVVMGAMLVFAQPKVKNKLEEVPPEPFKGIEVTLLNSKDGSVLATVKDIRHINQLKEALKELPIDRSEPYIHCQLKAGKNTPMGEITPIKQVLREHYILNLNYETSNK